MSFGRYLAFCTFAGIVLALLAALFAVAFWATLYVGVVSDGGWSSLSLGSHTADGWTWWPGFNSLFSWFGWPPSAGVLTVALAGLLGVVPLLDFKDASFVCLALLIAPIVGPVFLLTVATLGVVYVLDLAVTTVSHPESSGSAARRSTRRSSDPRSDGTSATSQTRPAPLAACPLE